MNEIVKKVDTFPVLSGNIKEDTQTIVSEMGVGKLIEERAWARLWLVWSKKSYMKWKVVYCTCQSCNDEYPLADDDDECDDVCPKCGADSFEKVEKPRFPTLDSYVDYICEETGRSRQTVFNRVGTFSGLNERGVDDELIFQLNLISSGAARMLANADEDDANLVNDSWEDTVFSAISTGNKTQALELIKHEVLNKPRIRTEFDGEDTITIEVERNLGQPDDYILEKYVAKLQGEWPEDIVKSLRRRFTL